MAKKSSRTTGKKSTLTQAKKTAKQNLVPPVVKMPAKKTKAQRAAIQSAAFSGPKIVGPNSRAGTKKITLTPRGSTPTFPWFNAPESGWLAVEDHDNWRDQLPNSYTYRLRAVDNHGKAITITRKLGVDPHGLLYCGETGVKENDPSFRGEKLAAGVADRKIAAKASAHGGAKKFWKDGWDKTLPAGYKLQFGWDTQTDFIMPANKDANLPENVQLDEMIENSGKGWAMGVEKRIIDPYKQKHREWPPLNSADSPGFRNRDRKTGNTLPDDRKPRDKGEVDVEIKDR
jgi:hypothetical protein